MNKTGKIIVPEFNTRIKLLGINPYIDLGSAQNKLVTKKSFVPVIAKVNKHAFETNLVPLGKGKFRLYLHGIIRKKAKVDVGDVVAISLKENTRPPIEKIPELLLIELKKDPLMKNNWENLAPSRQKEISRYLNHLKTEGSMKRNIEKVVRMLTKDPKQKMAGISVAKRTAIILFLFTLSSLIIFSCKKKKTSEALFNETHGGALYFYKGKDTIYAPAGTSPHGYFKLKFNQTALNAFGPDGKLPSGQSFPEGSLIVKEIYNSSNEKTLYAVMKKDSKSKFASHKWLWAEYELNGDAKIGINREGKDCVSCHTSGTTRDLTLSFDLH